MKFKGLYFLWLPEGLKAKKILGLRRDLLKNHEDYFNKYPAELIDFSLKESRAVLSVILSELYSIGIYNDFSDYPGPATFLLLYLNSLPINITSEIFMSYSALSEDLTIINFNSTSIINELYAPLCRKMLKNKTMMEII